MKAFAVAVATGLGAGYAPVAPGTWGALIGVAIYLLVRGWSLPWQLVLVAAITLLGTWASTQAERHFRREDPGQVVVDEVAGQLVTLVATGASGVGLLLGFGLFRAFDIFKPWPVRQCEAWHGGLGIMADDVMAGLYAHLVLQIILRSMPGVF